MTEDPQPRKCYFCREDAEVALDNHHIVPKHTVGNNVDMGQDVLDWTVALCGNCHRKFHTILDPALEFVANRIRQRVHAEEQDTEFQTAAEL